MFDLSAHMLLPGGEGMERPVREGRTGRPDAGRHRLSPVLKLRILVCAVVFLLCAAFKLLFPASAAAVGAAVCGWIDGDDSYVQTVEDLGRELARGDGLQEVFGRLGGLWLPGEG